MDNVPTLLSNQTKYKKKVFKNFKTNLCIKIFILSTLTCFNHIHNIVINWKCCIAFLNRECKKKKFLLFEN